MNICRPKILDCTLRDGGYYNEWDFSSTLARKLFTSLNGSGVDIVEVGYKAPPQKGFAGLYRYCPESQLEFLRSLNRVEYAVMIDAKEFLGSDGKVDVETFDRCFRPRAESLFRWCRVATHNATVAGATELVRRLRALGYKAGYNAMGISLLTEQQIEAQLRAVAACGADVFYFADSFGSLRPEDVLRYLKLIRGTYPGAIGIHTHDNQGLAFANSEAAIAAGVDFVDGTVMGMGRGAGNLKTEQLLLSLYFRQARGDLDPYALVDVIEQEFLPLHQRYKWGWDFAYMVSGLQNIHPTYCQKLKSTHQFTMGQVASILRAIPDVRRSSFSAEVLARATNDVLPLTAAAPDADRVSVPRYAAPRVAKVLVVGTGPSVKEHASALRRFIAEEKPFVIECNHTGALDEIPRIVAVLNEVRLGELLRRGLSPGVMDVVTGLESVSAEHALPALCHVPTAIRVGAVRTEETLTIPALVVGMFAAALGLQLGARRLYLAGFDGYTGGEHASEQQEMQIFWNQLRQQSGGEVEICSLLPTSYELPVASVYGLLR